MSGVTPQALIHDFTFVLRIGLEASKLVVADGFEEQAHSPQDDS
jgi:hypothetical protein